MKLTVTEGGSAIDASALQLVADSVQQPLQHIFDMATDTITVVLQLLMSSIT